MAQVPGFAGKDLLVAAGADALAGLDLRANRLRTVWWTAPYPRWVVVGFGRLIPHPF